MVAASVESTTAVTTAGLIDAHSHLRATGYADHGVSGQCLEEGLLKMSAMTSVNIDDDAFVACSDLLVKGVTGVQMMFHRFGDSSDYLDALDATVSGIRRSGIRALVVLGTTDQAEFAPLGVAVDDLLPEPLRHLRRLTQDEFVDVLAQARQSYPDITFGVGPVGPQWCSDGLLHLIGDLSQQGLRIHTHFAESTAQRRWAGNIFERMKKAKLFGPSTSLAHAIWLDPNEMTELADLGVSLVTCPLSNRILGAGKAPVDQWEKAGLTFGVGLDSADPDAPPMSIASLALTPDRALSALTSGGLSATGIDTTEDVVVWADDDLTRVDSVAVGGRVLVRDGKLVRIDEVRAAREAIAATMTSDAAARAKRLADLERTMPGYLEAVEAGLTT